MNPGHFKFTQGWVVWLLALGLAFALPGAIWHRAPPVPFKWETLFLAFGILIPLAVSAPLVAAWMGPQGARKQALALLESPPDFVWGGLILAAWPAAWGPSAVIAFQVAFLAAALPTEVRWLCATLPAESPFPSAYGNLAVRRWRKDTLIRILPRWLAARLPLWLTAALVLERIFGVQGLGSDWTSRISTRDHFGLAAWMLAFALLWRATRAFERS